MRRVGYAAGCAKDKPMGQSARSRSFLDKAAPASIFLPFASDARLLLVSLSQAKSYV